MFFSGNSRLANPALPTNRSVTMTVLDVGTTKVCCVIARLHPKRHVEELTGRTHDIEVIGFGHQRSQGMKGGAIIELDGCEEAIRLAVDAAERRAGMTVESLIVNLSGNRTRSETFSVNVALSSSEVQENDIRRVLAAGRNHATEETVAVLHSLPIGYALDGNQGIKEPLGMIGERLGVDMHVVTASDASLRNLELAINRCHLEVENFVSSAYSSALACMVGDEAELGVACLDMGGGTTNVSVFMEGECVHCDSIAIGGQHVTTDLARGLSTSLRNAELIKVKHGSVLPGDHDEFGVIPVRQIADEDGLATNVPPSLVTKIIKPRAEEIFEIVRDRLHKAGFGALAGRRAILTGGASQLTGIADLGRAILAKNVRIGRPLGISGLPQEARGAAFSTVSGLMIYPQVAHLDNDVRTTTKAPYTGMKRTGTGNYFGRVGRWLTENF